MNCNTKTNKLNKNTRGLFIARWRTRIRWLGVVKAKQVWEPAATPRPAASAGGGSYQPRSPPAALTQPCKSPASLIGRLMAHHAPIPGARTGNFRSPAPFGQAQGQKRRRVIKTLSRLTLHPLDDRDEQPVDGIAVIITDGVVKGGSILHLKISVQSTASCLLRVGSKNNRAMSMVGTQAPTHSPFKEFSPVSLPYDA